MGYTPFNNDADRLTHRPERVHEHQWRSLVYYWGTRKAHKKSTKNKEIRKKKTLNHITGRKPFSVVRVEETNKKNGVPATRLEVWMAGYSKDNKPSNDKVAEVMIDAKYSDDSSFKYTYLTTKMETRSSKVSCILSENPTTKMEEYNIVMKKMMRNPYEYHHDLGMNYTLITDKLIVGSQPQKPEDIDHLKREEDVAYIKMLICVHQMLYSSILLLQFYYYYFGSVLITGKPDDVCFCLNELDDSPVDAILMLCCS